MQTDIEALGLAHGHTARKGAGPQVRKPGNKVLIFVLQYPFGPLLNAGSRAGRSLGLAIERKGKRHWGALKDPLTPFHHPRR